jgi:hypothetical protein
MLIALATWSRLPELAEDDRLLLDHLPARAVVWDDRSVDWNAFDAIVIRSTWDYHTRIDEFRAWIDRLDSGGAKLWNPPALLRWNTHKRYLIELAARGVNVVPTLLTSRVMIKPAVSATAYRTSMLDPFDSEMLVQPFIDEVLTAGEWSLIFFRGAFSHAVIKRAGNGDFRVQNEFGGTWERAQPDPSLIAQAHAVLQTIDDPWLYARVDGVARDGRLLLMELEMTEPSLFLDGESAARFADAIRHVAGG